MNTVPSNDYFGLGKKSSEYLSEIFADDRLIANGDIYFKYENGEKYWYFSQYAAARITSYCLNFAAREISLVDRSASNPGNQNAWNALWSHSDAFIKTFMPGSSIRRGNDPAATNSNAIYEPTCN